MKSEMVKTPFGNSMPLRGQTSTNNVKKIWLKLRRTLNDRLLLNLNFCLFILHPFHNIEPIAGLVRVDLRVVSLHLVKQPLELFRRHRTVRRIDVDVTLNVGRRPDVLDARVAVAIGVNVGVAVDAETTLDVGQEALHVGHE